MHGIVTKPSTTKGHM